MLKKTQETEVTMKEQSDRSARQSKRKLLKDRWCNTVSVGQMIQQMKMKVCKT